MTQNTTGTSGVSLYSRKILIQHKTEHILPKWLRFLRGVVDSEDIPLNLSRELLQNSALIRYGFKFMAFIVLEKFTSFVEVQFLILKYDIIEKSENFLRGIF